MVLGLIKNTMKLLIWRTFGPFCSTEVSIIVRGLIKYIMVLLILFVQKVMFYIGKSGTKGGAFQVCVIKTFFSSISPWSSRGYSNSVNIYESSDGEMPEIEG